MSERTRIFLIRVVIVLIVVDLAVEGRNVYRAIDSGCPQQHSWAYCLGWVPR